MINVDGNHVPPAQIVLAWGATRLSGLGCGQWYTGPCAASHPQLHAPPLPPPLSVLAWLRARHAGKASSGWDFTKA